MAGMDAGKMIGPLPLGAWAAVVAGGLGIALYTRRNNTAPSGPVEEWVDTGGQPGVGTGGSGMGWVDVSPPATGGGGGAPDPVTNEEWGRKAVNYLIAQGYDSLTSDSAIRKYLGAENMGAQEFALVRVALAKLGSPPVPLPPPLFAPPGLPKPKPSPIVQPIIIPPKLPPPKPGRPLPGLPPKPVPKPVPRPLPKPPLPKPRPIPKPVPKPTPKPVKPNVKYHTVLPGQTLWGIAQRYYKKPEWQRIYNANRYGTRRADGTNGMIRNANLIYPGWKLIIP